MENSSAVLPPAHGDARLAVDGLDTAIAQLTAARDRLVTVGAAPAELMSWNDRLGQARRLIDAMSTTVAVEIARQSRPELGKDSLARRQGYRTAQTMIATTTGVSIHDAQRIIQVGEATAPRTNLVGERLPARHPHIAAAVTDGSLGVAQASAIVAMLDRVAVHADHDSIERIEKALAQSAPTLTPDQFTKALLYAQGRLDPNGQEPRDAANRAARSLTIREDSDGMVTIIAKLDAASAAPVKTALEAIVTQRFRRAGGGHANEQGDAPADTDQEEAPPLDAQPGVKHLLADALVDVCRHAICCTEVPTGTATTVVVRMTLAELESGRGTAELDGICTPIGAETARALAVDAAVIPCVLGDKSEILDWGRAKRLFTPAQKLALVERDGGCAYCGAPPGQTAVHHIRWWARDGGATDLDNGLLLCTTCHHLIHDDEWEIRIDGTGTRARVWFIPPPFIDHERKPRLGGNARYRLAA